MSEVDAIDVLLRVQRLQAFVRETATAASSIKAIGTAAGEANAAAAGGAGAGAGAGAADAKAAATARMMGFVKKAAIGTGLAVVGIGVEATKMGIKFDETMLRIQTQAGESGKWMGHLTKGVLDMAGAVGFSPQSLSEGLYHLTSVGIRHQKSLEDLKVAADLAGVGHANLETSTNALAAAWSAGVKGGGEFKSIAAELNAAVGSGNVTLQQMAEALGSGILVSAKTAGLSIQNVLAGISTLTDAGWKASSAAAQLATAFHYLYAPTGKASKALASMNLTGLDLIKTMRSKGLGAAINELRTHVQQFSKDPNIQAQKINEIIPGGRGRTLLGLLNMGPRMEEKELFQKAATQQKFAEAVKKYHETAAFKIRAAWSGVQTDLTRLGKALEPIAVALANALRWVADALMSVGHWLRGIGESYKHASDPMKALMQFAAVFLGQIVLLLPAIKIFMMLKNVIMLAGAAIKVFSLDALFFFTTPMGMMVLAIMIIVGAIVLMITHWKRVQEVAREVWKWMVTAWKNTVDWIIKAAEDVFSWFKKNWPLLLVVLTGPFGLAALFVIRHWKEIIKFFEGIPGVIGKAFSSLGEIIAKPFIDAFKWVEEKWKAIGHLPGISILSQGLGAVGGILGLADGGMTTSAGSVLVGERGPEILNLPRGASVVPLDRRGEGNAAGSTGNLMAHVTTQVVMDRRVVAEAVGLHTVDKIARR